ncbi:Alpha/Beta hydrolase protein [Pavlovales sp. CCMP2436]|nr:Alpha/Beta hydrolase protein [Pavlovales sp. CCMP2436]
MGMVQSLVNSIAFPRPPRGFSEAELLRRPDLVWLRTSTSKTVPAIYRKHATSAPRFTLVYSHGNAEDVGLSLSYIDFFADLLNVDVLAYEYLGYSVADGEPSESGLYESIEAAWDYLSTHCGVQPESIVLFGRSLGSAPTIHLASRRPRVGGMVLQSPLASGVRVVGSVASSIILKPCDPFQNYAKIHRVKCRTVVMHGREDCVVPFWHGLSLHEALAKRQLAFEPFWPPGCGHNDMPENLCVAHILEFLRSLPPLPPTPSGVTPPGLALGLHPSKNVSYDASLTMTNRIDRGELLS